MFMENDQVNRKISSGNSENSTDLREDTNLLLDGLGVQTAELTHVIDRWFLQVNSRLDQLLPGQALAKTPQSCPTQK